jgi:hypothetical protein
MNNGNASDLRDFSPRSSACSLGKRARKSAETKAAMDASIVRSEACARTNRAG